MAEVQNSPVAGSMTQRFIEFTMMQAQQASLFLGRIPHPQTGKSEVNLDAARLFIDHLEMIEEKTRGNLSQQESDILASILADLRMGFVQASNAAAAAPDAETQPAAPESPAQTGDEKKKKFTKSYES